jgi:hypothetical protein
MIGKHTKHNEVCEVDDQLCQMARWSIKKGLAENDIQANFFLVAFFVIITATTLLLAQATFREKDPSVVRQAIERSIDAAVINAVQK